MEYKDIFKPETLKKLNTKSAENLKTMLGDKNLMQTIMSSQKLLAQISAAEAPYKAKLEKLAVDMIKELYPIISQEGIKLDAKIGDIGSVTGELDEITINKPEKELTRKEWSELINNQSNKVEDFLVKLGYPKNSRHLYVIEKNLKPIEKHQLQKILKQNLTESLSPESRRRIINAVTQGAALRGAFAFYLFKEHLDDLDPSLVEKYNQIMKNSFGIYDDENAIAMMLAALAQGQKMAGGTSKVIIKEIAIADPHYFRKYKEAAIGVFEELKEEVSSDYYIYYNDIIDSIKNAKSENEINDIIWKKFFFSDDTEGFEEFKSNIQYNLNEITVNKPHLFIYHPPDGMHWGALETPYGTVLADWNEENKRYDIIVDPEIAADTNLINYLHKYNINKNLNSYIIRIPDKLVRFTPTTNEINLNEAESGITIKARAINFPMLVHELIKGLYELISLQGFKGDKAANQATVDKVDLLKNEPSDIRYGKFIFDALNKVFNSSEFSDDLRAREFFFIEVYKLDDEEFISFIENALNDELTSTQQKWVKDTLRDITIDLKADDVSELNEITVNKPNSDKFIIHFWEDGHIKYDTQEFIGNLETAKTKATKELNKQRAYRAGNYSATIEMPEYPTEGKFGVVAQVYESSPLDKIIVNTLLKEYSDKTIATTIERWKKEDPKVDDNVAKQLIQRFDQIKGSLGQKLTTVVLPDALKQGQNYLNIDKYSFDDMAKLIRSLPENPEKIKKAAIENFIKRDMIDKATAQSYVARFMANKDKLKYAAENGTEDESFTAKEVKEFIPSRLLVNNAFLDPRNWKWEQFEQMLDAIFPSQKTVTGEDENLASVDADKVYDKGDIEIYKGDDVHKCISYNPVVDKRKKYGWCVTQVGNTNYDYYRFGDKAPTFYFVFDKSKTSEPNYAPFKDQWHAFVIQVTADGQEYIVTGANNRGDENVKGWENVSKVVPSETWAKIKNLKDYFKPIGLSPTERARKLSSGKNLTLDQFKELDQDEKILYVQAKASTNKLSNDILKILPQYKISLEGRSTTLANVAIDSRQKFPYSALKDNEALAKRYAVVSSRYYPDDPLPLPFIKYLDEAAKDKYLEKYDDKLTFEYIEKYFGEKKTQEYVDKQVKNLDYLPASAAKYIKDPKLKQLFEIYSKLFDSWEFSSGTNMSAEELEDLQNAPPQSINPKPLNEKQWKKLSSSERKAILDLAEKFNQNLKYTTLLYGLPFVIKDGSNQYALLPVNDARGEWAMVDAQGKVIKDKISEDTILGDIQLSQGYPLESEKYNRIYDIKDLKIR